MTLCRRTKGVDYRLVRAADRGSHLQRLLEALLRTIKTVTVHTASGIPFPETSNRSPPTAAFMERTVSQMFMVSTKPRLSVGRQSLFPSGVLRMLAQLFCR